jgi:cystinosin
MTTTDVVSEMLGWGYFLAWSASFWPQVVLNYRNKSARGLSLEFQTLNLLGFSCYTIYNLGLYVVPRVKDDDVRRNHGQASNLVKPNDLAFSLHALIMTTVTLLQIYKYDEGRRLALWCKTVLGCVLVVLNFVLIETLVKNEHWDPEHGLWAGGNLYTWLGWLTLVSTVKLGVTCVKCEVEQCCSNNTQLTTTTTDIPQVYLNYQRKSTEGWSMTNVFLDLTGGFLSLAQLVWDASASGGDWSRVSDNPVKFGLGFVSIGFDAVFCVQHFVWYRHRAVVPTTDDESQAFVVEGL